MSKPKAIFVIPAIIILAIGLAVVYLLFISPDKTAAPSKRTNDRVQTAEKSDEKKAPVQPLAAAVAGTYVPYRDGIIAETKGEKLLFFHAPWCPQCRALDADIKEKGVPDNTAVIKVDYDSSQALRQKYGVTIQTTIVRVDDQGNEVKKYVAYDDPTLAAVIKGTR